MRRINFMINRKTLNFILILSILALVSCSIIQKSGNSSKTETSNVGTTIIKTPASQTNNLTGIKTIKCDDPDGTDTTIKGKTTLFYDDGTKQAFSDYCPGKNTILNVFVQEYYCDGINIKSKIYKCTGTCEDGACIPLQGNQSNQT